MKSYKKFTIYTEPFNVEMVSSFLWDLDIDGITENDDNLSVFIVETKSIGTKEISEKLRQLMDMEVIENFTITEDVVEDQNWNEEWEKKINPIEVTDKIVIKPSFRDYDAKEGQVIIELDPKMSFGTGEHETTKLVLTLIDKHIKGNEKVLDVGCGTAVLAIAAVKLGAGKAIAFDNDDWCLLNGTENAKLNKIEDKVEVRLCEISGIEEKDFDLIVANINRHILLDIVEALKSKVAENGKLILSGLLDVDETDIRKVYESAGFKIIEKTQMNEWIALVMKVE
ncbi:MAG: 50S ribosomal protein L11 methyltransferase [Melioribacteraceae bacterium]|nr:50S ribosomal protein L11 methyltransferase [Melioribacteraceae bacterium]